ncbi:hypothetical protein [Bartonella sp. MM73XJBT.G]|nr:hypothetical protein [Bartonella sp. MM73XJBT.G]
MTQFIMFYDKAPFFKGDMNKTPDMNKTIEINEISIKSIGATKS